MKPMVPATLVAALALGAGTALAAETWDMATPYPDANFHTRNIMQFAEEVEQATNGELSITIHPAGSLFPHAEIKNAVRSGQINIGEFLLSLISNENEAFGVDSLPFLATSYEDAMRLWEIQEPVVTELLERQGLMALYTVPWPPQGLYTSREINTVADLQGLKFRSYNATMERFAELAGAAPVQVEAPDIPQAFSTGRVESMMTSPSTGVNSKAWDFVDRYYDIRAWMPKNVVVVNKAAFDALAPEVQEAVRTAAAAAEERGRAMSEEETTTMTEELAKNGMTVAEPSPELAEGLRDLGTRLLESWSESAGDDATKIVDEFRG